MRLCVFLFPTPKLRLGRHRRDSPYIPSHLNMDFRKGYRHERVALAGAANQQQVEHTHNLRCGSCHGEMEFKTLRVQQKTVE